MQAMFYKIQACNNLRKDFAKENHIKYDYVIRLRTDIMLETPLDLKHNQNNLFIPSYGDYGGINDQFAYGSEELMDIYSSIYDNMFNYLEEGCGANPEHLVKFCLQKNGINPIRTNDRYHIRRQDGSILQNKYFEQKMGFIK